MNVTYAFKLDNRSDRFGYFGVYLRITVNRKQKHLKTGVTVLPHQFDKRPEVKNNVVQWIVKHEERKRLNVFLSDFLENAKKAQDHPTAVAPTAESLKQHIKQPPGTITVGAFFEQALEQIGGSFHYRKHLKSRLMVFAKWAGADTLLKSINLEMLNRFKRDLQKEGLSSSTQHYYFLRLSRVLRLALKLEYIDRDPFIHFEMPKDQPAQRLKLSDEQVADLEAFEVDGQLGESLWLYRAKWLYLFSFRKAGMRAGDIIQLRVGNLDRKNNRLVYEMDKTGKKMSLKLSEGDWAIIRKLYDPETDGRPKTAYLFGMLDDDAHYARYVTQADKSKMSLEDQTALYNKVGACLVLINRNLKVLAEKIGVEGRLTFHTARHSFADKARRRMKETKNISIDDIRSALGHTSLATTQRYLASFDEEGLDLAMDAVFE